MTRTSSARGRSRGRAGPSEAGPGSPARPRKPARITPRSLENVALHYLSRFAATQASLRRVLMRRVARSARAHGTPREEGAAMVEDIVARFVRAGILDDAAYAEALARRLLRRGLPPKVIGTRLAAKGVSRDLAEQALARLREETADPELAAACRYVRRRRLGPYRAPGQRAAFHDKDLAAMGRAGFAFAVAQRVLAVPTAAEIEALLREIT